MATNTHWTFPRTMVRGDFKGQTFETQNEYQAARRAHTAVHGVKYHKRASKAKGNGQPAGVHEVRAIVNLYEALRSDGLGQEAAIRWVARAKEQFA